MGRSREKAERFLEFLRPLQGQLETYCRRLLRDRSQSEDALQSAVAAAFAAFDRYAQGTNFKAWMFRFVTYEIFNRNRKHEPIPFGEIPVDLSAEESWGFLALDDTVAALLENPDVLMEHFDDVVVAALDQLAPLERAVLLLRGVGDLSYREIQELLKIPLGSVMGYLSRGRKRLRISLAEYAAEHGVLRRNDPSREAKP